MPAAATSVLAFTALLNPLVGMKRISSACTGMSGTLPRSSFFKSTFCS